MVEIVTTHTSARKIEQRQRITRAKHESSLRLDHRGRLHRKIAAPPQEQKEIFCLQVAAPPDVSKKKEIHGLEASP